MSEKLSDIIQQSPLGNGLTSEECDEFAKVITTRTLSDDEILIKDGEIDNSLHAIAHGRLAVMKEAGAGEWATLHVLGEGDLAGALGFVDGSGHSATLRAVGDTEIFSLERDDFESLLGSHPRIVYQVMRAIIRSVHDIVRRMNIQHVELTNYITKSHGRY